jgi:hypothetical protein
MKKLIALLALIGCTVNAQAQVRQQQKQQQTHRTQIKRNVLKDLSPEQQAQLQTKRLALVLDLNDKQQVALLALHTKLAKQRNNRAKQLKAAKESGKKLSPDEKFEFMNNRLDAKLETKRTMKSVLTLEQYNKWLKLNQHRKKSRKSMVKRNAYLKQRAALKKKKTIQQKKER